MKPKDSLIETLLAVLILLPVVCAAVVWDRLPERMAIHFGPSGNPDSFVAKEIAIFLIPAISLSVSLLLRFLPLWRPLSRQFVGSEHNYTLRMIGFIRLLVVAFLCYAGIILVAHGVNRGLDVTWMVVVAAVIMLTALSVGMIHTGRNRIYGIRNRWTLSSDVVWRKTHVVWGWISSVMFSVLAVSAMWLSGSTLMLVTVALLIFVVVGATVFSCCLSIEGK